MLTQIQKQFISKIPEDTIAAIKPWDPKAAEYARLLVQKIEKNLGLQTFWEGSLSLRIAGENDIDLYIFSEPNDFDKYLPDLVTILGEPTYRLAEKILWRIKKDGHKIDASLASKDSPEVKLDMFFYTSLKKTNTTKRIC